MDKQAKLKKKDPSSNLDSILPLKRPRKHQSRLDYIASNTPQSIAANTLSGFLMNLLKAKPNLTKEEIYSELSSGYKNLRKGDGGRYPNEISKSLRAALFANQLFIEENGKFTLNLPKSKDLWESLIQKAEQKKQKIISKEITKALSEAYSSAEEANLSSSEEIRQSKKKRKKKHEAENKPTAIIKRQLSQKMSGYDKKMGKIERLEAIGKELYANEGEMNVEIVNLMKILKYERKLKSIKRERKQQETLDGMLDCYKYFRPLWLSPEVEAEEKNEKLKILKLEELTNIFSKLVKKMFVQDEHKEPPNIDDEYDPIGSEEMKKGLGAGRGQ